jgi:energy-converting hydrogenase Eha subunit E
MFLFYSNAVGIIGSIVVTVVLSLILLYACSGT